MVATEVGFARGAPNQLTRSVWELFICEFERLGREIRVSEEEKVQHLIQALPQSVGGLVLRLEIRSTGSSWRGHHHPGNQVDPQRSGGAGQN